ncbi:MAG: aldo/keto reductase [Acetobacteraceae bacterium]|nr:aldo/keto reductase [Acetobacteraceae bacterium]
MGFGAGGVGGLMVRGSAVDQERAVARAVDAGVNYFDTAPDYGSGESELTLGRVLKSVKAEIVVGTKVRLRAAVPGKIAAEITASLEASLQRLGRDSVDLFQLHNPLAAAGAPTSLPVATVMDEVLPALERLQGEGKIRYLGVTAIGEAAAMHAVVASGRIDSAQVPLNMLNPSPVRGLPAGFPANDYRQLMLRARENGVGVIGIRVLAAGALSGVEGRHPTAMQSVPPIGTAATYEADLANARRLLPLVQEGHAGSLVEAAMRYAISNDCMSTVLVGFSDLDHLEAAIAAFEKGPLPPAAMARVAQLQARIAAG